jgi:hypothetical protein
MAIVQDMDAEGLHASPLIIRLIIQTIRLDLWIDDPSNLSRADPSGADQSDAEHQATDRRSPLTCRSCHPVRRQMWLGSLNASWE